MSVEFGGAGFDPSSYKLETRDNAAKNTEQTEINRSSLQEAAPTQGQRQDVEATAKAIVESTQSAEKSTDDRIDTVQAAEALLQVARNLNQDIKFSLDADNLDVPIIQVIDRETGDVVRQIPTDDFLKLAGRIQELSDNEQIESATGFLIDSRV